MDKYIKIAYMIMLDPLKVPLLGADNKDVKKAVNFLEKHAIDQERVEKQIKGLYDGTEQYLKIAVAYADYYDGKIDQDEFIKKLQEIEPIFTKKVKEFKSK